MKTFILVLLSMVSTLSLAKESIRTSFGVYPIDQAIEIQASGLNDGQEYTIRAETKDKSGRSWSSYAVFVAKNGQLDFSQKPVRGTYSTASTQGLFWSMLPENYQSDRDFFRPADPFRIDLKLLDSSQKLSAEHSFSRQVADEALRTEERRTAESFFDLVLPQSKGKKPAVLLLGGSEGGLNSGDARVIASHGFVVMALAYFGVDPLPKELSQIPLEYIYRNAMILKTHPEVDPTRIVIWGTSKGGELALLSAATYPELFNAVVGVVPSSFVWQGLTSDFKSISSWSAGGTSIPFLSFVYEEADFQRPPFKLRVGYDRALQITEDKRFAEIPVEKINGPILLVSGTDDQVWPSATMANLAADKLKKTGFKHEVVNLVYKDAGHFIGLPSWPTSGRIFGTMHAGGNQEADGLACADSWPKIIQFLKKSFGDRSNH